MASNVTSADDVFGRIIKSIFALVVLLLFSAAVFTYSPTDPPILYGGSSGEVYNWIGWAGAFVSHLLFMHIGLCTYLLCFLFALHIIRCCINQFHPVEGGISSWQGWGGAFLILCGALLLFGLVPESFDEILPLLGLGHKESIKSGLSGGRI